MNMEQRWEAVDTAVAEAKAIAWDGCHKIYVLMDDEQVALQKSYGYGEDDDGSLLIPVADVDTASGLLRVWYERSCGLRFINAVRTVDGDPNDGYTQLIPQFAEEE